MNFKAKLFIVNKLPVITVFTNKTLLCRIERLNGFYIVSQKPHSVTF